MDFYIMTLFPDMVMEGLNTSITGRAVSKGLLSVEAVNIRDYAFNKHNSVDDYPYGGGAGMLMQAEPVYQCYKSLKERIRLKRLKKEQDGAGKSDNQKKNKGSLSLAAGTDVSPVYGRGVCQGRGTDPALRAL